MSAKLLDKVFPPREFSQTTTSNVLQTAEKSIIAVTRDEEETAKYLNFDSGINLYLSKMSTGIAKKYVSKLMNLKLAFMGRSLTKDDGVFARVFMTSNKLSGIVLDSLDLGIDLNTGDVVSVDDCVYALYFGMLRAAVVLFKDSIRTDKNLHKALSVYLFLLIMKSIDKNIIYTSKQRSFVQIVCTYAYYRHFLGESHSYTVRTLQKDYKDVIEQSDLREFLPQLDTIKHYSSTKDLPKMLVDTNILRMNPNEIIIGFFKKFRTQGIYTIFGPLDSFVGMSIISKYPTELYTKETAPPPKIHSTIESIMDKYLAKISFEVTVLLNPKRR